MGWFPVDPLRLPTRQEITDQHAALSQLSTELASLTNKRRAFDLQRASLKAQLVQLETEDASTQQRITEIEEEKFRREVWIAPHRRLSRELLVHVFHWHSLLQWNAPVVDASVCKLWRVLCLSTPCLWTYLRFPSGIPTQLIDLWLSRAHRVPFHIHLNSEIVPPSLEGSLASTFCLKWSPRPTLLSNYTFTALEKLILDHEEASLEHLWRGVFTLMPKLRKLHLHWLRPSRRPILVWSWDLPPLTEFHFCCASWAWIDAVSQITNSLTHLALDIGDVSVPPPSTIPVDTLVFPKLRYFAYGAQSCTLLIDDSARVPIVAKVISAPNLKSFEDHSVTPLEFSVPLADNWSFPTLSHYLGQTSRELGSVKSLFPRVKIISFVVDSETGVLDVATLIDDAREGTLEQLEELEMWRGDGLRHHPMIEQSLREYEKQQDRSLVLRFLGGRDETAFQQVSRCFFSRASR